MSWSGTPLGCLHHVGAREALQDAEFVVLLFLRCLVGEEWSCLSESAAEAADEAGHGPRALQGTASSGESRRAQGPQKQGILSEQSLSMLAQAFYLLDVLFAPGDSASASPSALSPRCMRIRCTERDLYYRDPRLFARGRQGSVQRSIRRVCAWMQMASVARAAGAVGSAYPLQGVNDRGLPHGLALFTQPWKTLARWTAHTHREGPGRTLGYPYTRESLGITAAGKSLLVGHLRFDLPAGVTAEPDSAPHRAEPLPIRTASPPRPAAATITVSALAGGVEGLLLTHVLAQHSLHYRAALTEAPSLPAALVFVEKECALRSLITNEDALGLLHHGSPPPPLVFLCTKGYPCAASRCLVRRLHAAHPQLPLLALVDGDPHGLCILLTMIGAMGSPTRTPDTVSPASHRQTHDTTCPTLPADHPPAPSPHSLLPFIWAGVQPSKYFTASDGPNPTAPTRAAFLPITTDDHAKLQTINRLTHHLLQSTSRYSTHPLLHQRIVHLLHSIQTQSQWIHRAQLKCELPTAAHNTLLPAILSALPDTQTPTPLVHTPENYNTP